MSGHERDDWEARWTRVVQEHGDLLGRRPPNAWLTADLADLAPGRALDAGCGQGTEALWLAARGWRVTAIDFAATALAQGRVAADAMGPDVAARVEWIEADIATWVPAPAAYDLVACLYVHVAGPVDELVRRLAGAVARGGTLFLVGHRPFDPVTGAPTPAADQRQVSVDEVRAALEPTAWELLTAAERERPVAGSGVDAVIRARRR